MDANTFTEKLALIFNQKVDSRTKDFGIPEDEWDPLATLATIALIHEQSGKSVPLENLQACKSALQVFELLAALQEKVEQVKP
jgi:hypothetical protein